MAELQAAAADRDERDALEFWHLAGAIETQLHERLERLLKDYDPEDRRLLFALFLSLKFIEELRVSTAAEKALAGRLAGRLYGRVASVGNEFVKEFKTLLLELRKGELVAVDEPERKESAEPLFLPKN